MQVTTEQLVAEAGAMALELRFKEKAIAQLEAEVAQLRERLAEKDGEEAAPEGE